MTTAVARTPAEEALGISLPSRRVEEWKWTDLRRLIDTPYDSSHPKAEPNDVDRLLATSPFAGVASRRIVNVNGSFYDRRSQIEGLRLEYREGATKVIDTITALNANWLRRSHALKLEGQVEHIIEIIHIATRSSPPRNLNMHYPIELGEDASATIIETFVGEGRYLNNSVTEYKLGRGARLNRIKFQNESRDAVHLSHVVFNLAEGAVLNDFTLQLGSKLTRQSGTLAFVGQNAEARISGTYLLNGSQHCDTTLVIDHRVPQCTSRELFKCVLDDESRGVFQGKVIVQRNAQKTDGKQSCNALLLSPNAEFDAKPELEIFADDVVCGHGATAGELDHDHLFYLKSRGIPEAEAKKLLVVAFASEAFDTVENEQLREALIAIVHGKVEGKS